ncbi:MAG: LysR family transcriptional regulator [Pseudomonadota bacterium]
MKKIDFHALDGHVLRTFLVILEESSVSRAADRLGVTQSNVSHTLAKLRGIFGDPLFVRSGQGITPTETALSLKSPVLKVLDGMRGLTEKRSFDPTSEKMHFRVAANDMQRDMLFPDFMREARGSGIDLTFNFMPSGVPSVGLLRDAACDLMVTPAPPNAPDLFQLKLFTGDMMCFYDPETMDPPKTMEDYLAADHLEVRFVLGGVSSDVLKAPDLPKLPPPVISVSNFSGITPFLKGTRTLATQLEYQRHTALKHLAMAPLPFHSEPVNFYIVWHERSTNDPAHRWLRDRIKEITSVSPKFVSHRLEGN